MSMHLLAVRADSYMKIHLYTDCFFCVMLLHSTHGIKKLKSYLVEQM